ncbi:Guanosine-5'-triphosphate,3'-diphosphate pyrophosphatase [compost metagenome]
MKENQTTLVVDVGGGSTEFITGLNGNILFGESLDIGAVRLTERFVTEQPVEESERQKLWNYIDQQLEKVLPELKKKKIDQIIAVAGTPTAIAAVELGGFDEKKVDGYLLSIERLKYWMDEFANTTVVVKQEKYQLGGRADIIFAGVSILYKLVKALNMQGLTVSTKGVRYGVALEMLSSASSAPRP